MMNCLSIFIKFFRGMLVMFKYLNPTKNGRYLGISIKAQLFIKKLFNRF